MMKEVLIQLEGVGVSFALERHRSAFSWVSNRVKRSKPSFPKKFVALDSIDFTLKHGERVGLVGRNGAGKTTLLRVLAEVILPTAGRVIVASDANVVPMLELGLGFQVDLTGRENCVILAALMGCNAEQTRQRIERAAEFAELGSFLDQPVKTYSSGMYARLAFSFATEIQPDVLLVDEILGVGDEVFQRKSSRRMTDLMEKGVAVVLVSHNLDFLASQTDRLVWLDKGRIVASGPPQEIAARYREFGAQKSSASL